MGFQVIFIVHSTRIEFYGKSSQNPLKFLNWVIYKVNMFQKCKEVTINNVPQMLLPCSPLIVLMRRPCEVPVRPV